MAATARAVDLSNVSAAGNFKPRRKPEGEYKARIVKADDHQPNDKSKPMGWVLTIQVDGDSRSTYPYYLSPDPKQAWKIGTVCRAAGLNVKNARVKFDPNKLVNKAIGIYLQDDEYEGREKSVIDDIFPVAEVTTPADEPVDEIEDEVLDDDEPIEEDEPVEEDDEEDEEPPAPPVRKRRAKPAPEPEPEDDEEEDEDDPEPTPPPRKTTRRKAAPKPPPVEDDDLDEIDLDDLDD